MTEMLQRGFVPLNFMIEDGAVVLAVDGSEPLKLDRETLSQAAASQEPDVLIAQGAWRKVKPITKSIEVKIVNSTPESSSDKITTPRTYKPCLTADPEIFGDVSRQEEAVAMCGRCTIEKFCAEEVIQTGKKVAVVFGGLRPQQINYRITQRQNS